MDNRGRDNLEIRKAGKERSISLSFPEVPDFLIQHVFQNTGDYLEIRKAGKERSIFPLFS